MRNSASSPLKRQRVPKPFGILFLKASAGRRLLGHHITTALVRRRDGIPGSPFDLSNRASTTGQRFAKCKCAKQALYFPPGHAFFHGEKEPPPLSAGVVIAIGNCGLYTGPWGVRIEDTVVVGKDGPLVLTNFSYALEPK